MSDVTTIDPFHARPMQMADWWRAYSIVRAICPRISAEQWRQHVTDLLRSGNPDGDAAGACVLACPKDYFYGLFTYRVACKLGFGRTLDIADFCVAPPTGRKSAADCLIRHAEALARNAGCAALSIAFLSADLSAASLPMPLPIRIEDAFVMTPPGLMKFIR